MIQPQSHSILFTLLMEFIRSKLERLANFFHSRQAQLEDYLRTFPDCPAQTSQTADSFVQHLNEIIMYVAQSISISCKNASPINATKSALIYSPHQVRKACKVKAILQQIRYAFLGSSSQRRVDSTQILHIFEEAVELCSNQLVYTPFKGATKGRSFEIGGLKCLNPQQKDKEKQESAKTRLKLMDQKRILYQEISSHLHAEQRKKRKQEKGRAITQIETNSRSNQDTSNPKASYQEVQYTRQQTLPQRKKYNYLQAFQREQKRLKEQEKQIMSHYSKNKNEGNSTSAQQHSKGSQRLRNNNQEQATRVVTEFRLDDNQDSLVSSNKYIRDCLNNHQKGSINDTSPQQKRICNKQPQSLHLEPSDPRSFIYTDS